MNLYFFCGNRRYSMSAWATSALLLTFSATLGWSQAAAPAPGSSAPASGTAAPSQAPAQPGLTGLKVRGPIAVSQTDPDRVVAVINGQKITAKQAMAALKTLTPEERKRFPETD